MGEMKPKLMKKKELEYKDMSKVLSFFVIFGLLKFQRKN